MNEGIVPTNEQVLLERWLDHVWMEKGLGDHTLSGYRSDLEQFALWLATQRSALLQADRIILLEWLSTLMQRGLSARSVARKMSALRGFYRWALRERLIGEDPTLQISRPKIGRPLPKSLTEADVAGPFVQIPDDMMEKAKLAALGYRNVAEALGERFHASPALLAELNPGKDLGRAGEEIVVPNLASAAPLAKAARVVVDKSDSTVTLYDAADAVIAQFPASTGSEHDPLPLGEWKILGVARNPEFKYSPKLFWAADPAHAKATVAAGPNNPVGVAWVALSKPHYGVHGTPEPSKIGKTESNGCIRLTNWNAEAMGYSVSPGLTALLQE